jgi:radical SAM superfamily enzyme YgiQ (UPF0313 family)
MKFIPVEFMLRKKKFAKDRSQRRIYFINPFTPDNFWTMKSSVKAVGVKALMPNNAVATLIALTPKDLDIEYVYCDENVSKIDFDMSCDLVALTGYTLHARRIREICDQFKKRNVPIALGGPYATLNPDDGRIISDYLFLNEAEYTWPLFLREWMHGHAKPLYSQKTFIDMTDSPPPDWSFIQGSDYLYFSVQTSRGCPNNCDFCDAVRLVGRRYRTKTIRQIMTEIKNAYRAGAETIFFSEDNFFVSKSFTMALLSEIIEWNSSLKIPVSFAAQATVVIGNDEEILKMLADARFSVIFLGVESIKKECLKEVNKGHLLRYDPYRSVTQLSRYGILPFLGFIVGFDHDNADTFTDLEEFLTRTGSPLASISILNSPENTTLYNRMKSRGRIDETFKGLWHLSTNIIPVSMSIDELIVQHRRLFRSLYQPENFERRALDWLSNIEYVTSHYKHSRMSFSKFFKLFKIMKYYVFHEPKHVRKMFFRMLKNSWKMSPRLFKKAVTIMSQYCHYYDFSHNENWHSYHKTLQ